MSTRMLLEQYGCGPVQLTGPSDALYERHLPFDNVVGPAAVGPRERYEAVARSVRDVLSQRWVRTVDTYTRETPSGSTTCRWSSSSGATAADADEAIAIIRAYHGGWLERNA